MQQLMFNLSLLPALLLSFRSVRNNDNNTTLSHKLTSATTRIYIIRYISQYIHMVASCQPVNLLPYFIYIIAHTSQVQ